MNFIYKIKNCLLFRALHDILKLTKSFIILLFIRMLINTSLIEFLTRKVFTLGKATKTLCKINELRWFKKAIILAKISLLKIIQYKLYRIQKNATFKLLFGYFLHVENITQTLGLNLRLLKKAMLAHLGFLKI